MTAEQMEFYDKLVEKNYPPLYRYAQYWLHDPSAAEVLAFDTLHEAFFQIDTVFSHENPEGWLFQTLKNKIKHHLRTAAHNSRRRVSMEEPDATETAAAAQAGDETHLTLLAIQELLPPEEYEFLLAVCRDKESYETLAERYGATVWACRKRMERIRRRLREEFPERREIF